MVQKLIVGLTGVFGSGKSEVSEIFRKLGAGTINADRAAHEALKKNSPVFKKIKVLFPDALSRCGRHFYREKIAERIFSDPEKRERLEALVHPYTYAEIRKKIAATKKQIMIVEVPLLFEAGFNKFCDKTITVKCKPSARRARLLAKGFSKQEIKKREAAQMPESLKTKKSDFVIDNSGPSIKTKRDVERLWMRFKSLLKGE